MAFFRTGKFNKEAIDERLAEPSSRKTLLQISRCICCEVSAQGVAKNGNGCPVGTLCQANNGIRKRGKGEQAYKPLIYLVALVSVREGSLTSLVRQKSDIASS
jgi:hypothetical protein